MPAYKTVQQQRAGRLEILKNRNPKRYLRKDESAENKFVFNFLWMTCSSDLLLNLAVFLTHSRVNLHFPLIPSLLKNSQPLAPFGCLLDYIGFSSQPVTSCPSGGLEIRPSSLKRTSVATTSTNFLSKLCLETKSTNNKKRGWKKTNILGTSGDTTAQGSVWKT